VQVIAHDNEFMQQIFSFVAIMRERVDQKVGVLSAPEDWPTLSGNGGDEEYAIGIHSGMLANVEGLCL